MPAPGMGLDKIDEQKRGKIMCTEVAATILSQRMRMSVFGVAPHTWTV